MTDKPTPGSKIRTGKSRRVVVPGIYGLPVEVFGRLGVKRAAVRTNEKRIAPWLLPGVTAQEINAWTASPGPAGNPRRANSARRAGKGSCVPPPAFGRNQMELSNERRIGRRKSAAISGRPDTASAGRRSSHAPSAPRRP